MDDSTYQFLSSLSPRIKPNRKNKYKGPTVLSLKQHIRRSTLDQKPRTLPNQSLSIIEISSTESSCDNESEGPKSPYTKCNGSNEIESSPLQDGTPSHTSFSDEEFISPSPQKQEGSFSCLSTTKKKTKKEQDSVLPRKNLFGVEKWLEDVEEATTKVRTEVLEPSLMCYEEFERQSYEQLASSTMVPIIKKDELILKQKYEINRDDSNDKDDWSKSYENLLDDIYGSTWRLKRDEILPRSEKKIKKKTKKIEKEIPKSERKPRDYDTFRRPYLDLPEAKSKYFQNKSKKLVKESPIITRLRNICDEDSDESFTKIDTTGDTRKNENNLLDDSLNDDFGACIKSDFNILSNSDKENFIDDEIIPLKDRIQKKLQKSQKNSTEPNTPIKKPLNKNIFLSPNDVKGKNRGESQSERKLNDSSKKHVSPHIVGAASENRNKWRSTSSTNSDEDKKAEKTLSFLASLSKNVPNSKCDLSAKIFKNNYKQCKVELAKKLFNIFNEKIFGDAIPKKTVLEWSERMLRTAGYCYSKKITHRTGLVEREARIVLSAKVLDSADRLRDTLIHEMCHAATWIIDEEQNGHGTYWKAWASKAMSIFPELPPIKTCHNYEISTKYVYKCMGCGYSIGRHRKSLDIERKRCGYCFGKFEIFMNKTNKKGEQKTVATPKKEPTGFALFVKENYSNLRVPGKTHADVMRQLGEEFRKLKV